ncbi:MAG: Fur family transcriptional regulator [Pseudomonadota bacterium]
MTEPKTAKPDTDRPRLSENEVVVLDALRKRGGSPISAYDLVRVLDGTRVRYAVTVYRALDKLIAAGLAHRIESANAFIACDTGCAKGQPVFAVCDDCGQTSELRADPIVKRLSKSAAEQGFAVSQMTLELHGTCDDCRTPNDPDEGAA